MEQVLDRLQKANFRANLCKCYFGESKIDYLGYEITRYDIQPQPKKVEAILKLSPPKTKRQLRHFLGMINYYIYMWQKRSHLLAPLTGLVIPLVKYKWGKEQQKAFDEIKQKVSQETLLAFPYFEKEFHVYTDASNKQLGAVIMQEIKPLAFYSRKLRGLILHQENSLQVMRGCVKLFPLPQPRMHARTYTKTNTSARGATQLRSVLVRVCSVSRQNLNTTTVP
jgi:hypothetical protein